MRIAILVIVALSFLLVKNNDEDERLTTCVGTKPSENQESVCNNNNMPDQMKCCYVKYKLGNNNFFACSAIINTEREINEYKDMLRDASDVDIQCKGKYLKVMGWMVALIMGMAMN